MSTTPAQILIVEDNQYSAKALKSELMCLGYGVIGISTSGKEAIQKTIELQPDLVLMDILLDDQMDGIETAEEILKNQSLPIVYLTGNEQEETLLRAKITEPFGYLVKPYEEKELHTTIEIAIYKHRMEQKLCESHAWLLATLNSVTDAIIATDMQMNTHFLNPSAEKLTEWKQKDIENKCLNDICNIFTGTRKPLDTLIHKALRNNEVGYLPTSSILTTRLGNQIPIEGTVSSIQDNKGNPSGLILTLWRTFK